MDNLPPVSWGSTRWRKGKHGGRGNRSARGGAAIRNGVDRQGLVEGETSGKPRDEEVMGMLAGGAFQAEGIAHTEVLSQKPACRRLELKCKGQEGAKASGIRLVFSKVVLVTVRIQGGQEGKLRGQAPAPFR